PRTLHSCPTRRSSDLVEHVELGQGDAGDARDRARLAHQHRVEPAAAALARGYRAEFVPALAEPLADRIGQLARKRARADPGGVGDRKSTRLNSSHVKI